MDQQIRDSVEEELPRLKSLYVEKARAIMAEARKKTVKYLEALNKHKERSFSRKFAFVRRVEVRWQKLLTPLVSCLRYQSRPSSSKLAHPSGT